MKKIYFVDECIDGMGGIERVFSILSASLSSDFQINLISKYKKKKTPHFKFNQKIEYMYDMSNLLSKKMKKIKIIYYFLRTIEKMIENTAVLLNSKRIMRKIPENATVIFGRFETAYEFLPLINNNTHNIVREASQYYYHKNIEKIIDLFNQKIEIMIVPSEASKEIYKSLLKETIKIEKIYNPLDLKQVKPNSNNKVIVSAGRFDSKKGYEVLIEAFKLVNKPDWELWIVGEGYYHDELLKLKYGHKNIKILPAVKDITEIYKQASIYVMPSRFEGYANSLIEAMASGLAVISFDWLMGVEDIINDHLNGLIVRLQNPIEYFFEKNVRVEDILNLKNKINYLIENKGIREKLGNEAINIRKNREKKIIILKWKQILFELGGKNEI